MKKRLIGLLVIFSSIAILSGNFLAAQSNNGGGNEDGENITISPAVARPNLKAGQDHSAKITVINNGSVDYTFIAYARPFSAQGEAYQADFETINEYTEAFSWIKFEKSSYELKAGENITVPYTIEVPEDARGGGHYAVIFAETQPKQEESVARKKRVGSLVYATVDGSFTEKGSVEEFTSQKWFKNGPITSSLRIRNEGNTHFDTKTDITYSNIFGKAVYNDKQDRIVLPGTIRKFTTEWQKPPLFGVFKVSGNVSYLDKTETLPSSYILIMPLWLMAALAVGLLTIIVLVVVRSKKRR